MNLYELASELKMNPDQLAKWFKKSGMGNGKGKLTHKAVSSARLEFAKTENSSMHHVLTAPREGLGDPLIEDPTELRSSIKIEKRPIRHWGKRQRELTEIDTLDPSKQKELFKSLRVGRALKRSSESSVNQAKTDQAKTDQTKKGQHKNDQPDHAYARKVTATPDHTSLTSTTSIVKSEPIAIPTAVQSICDSNETSTEAIQTSSTPSEPLSNNVNQSKSVHAAKERTVLNQAQHVLAKVIRKAPKKVQDTCTPPTLSIEPAKAKKVKKAKSKSLADQSKKTAETDSSFKGQFYKKEHERLLSQFHQLKQQHTALKTQYNELNEALIEAKKAAIPSPPSIKENASNQQLLWDAMQTHGLTPEEACGALAEVFDHPQRGQALLFSLMHPQPERALDGFAFSCEHSVCQDIALVDQHLTLLYIDETRCPICMSSANRRWFQRLLMERDHTGPQRILIVGGSAEDYATLKQLDREYPGLSWSFIEGCKKMDQSRVKQRIEGADVIVLWGGVHLPHSLSDLFKAAAMQAKRPCFAFPPGQRSPALLCQGILKSWGIEVDDM